MTRVLLNRDTERVVFNSPAVVTFKLRKRQGIIQFGVQAIKEMNLKAGGRVELEIDGTDWYVMKTDNPKGFTLVKSGGRHSVLHISSNRCVRGFMAKIKAGHDGTLIRCSIERDAASGKVGNYARYKIIYNHN